MLTRNKIESLFRMLNEKCKKRKITGEIGIVGGAVMCLVYRTRPSTKDIDRIFAPTQKIRELVAEISAEEGLPSDWLNDGAKGYLGENFKRIEVLNLSNLRVWAPQPEYMLAMKCISARFDTNDSDDVIFLIKHLGLKSVEQVLAVAELYYPKKRIPIKTSFFIEELIEKIG